MSGQCYSCGTSFSFLRKEKGCKNCGYSFCKKCLVVKLPVPKLNNEKHEVCSKCRDTLTGKAKPSAEKGKMSPPENFKKRMAALSDPAVPRPLASNVTVKKSSISSDSKTSVKDMDKYKGLDGKDLEIAERLQKLKEERKAKEPTCSQSEIEERMRKLKADKPKAPSDAELRERLAIHRGKDPSQAETKHVFPTDQRSDQQKIDDLITNTKEEVDIDARFTNQTSPSNTSVPENTGSASEPKEEDLDEVQMLIRQAAANTQMDAEKAYEDLKDDKKLWEEYERLKKKQQKGQGNQKEDEEEDAEEDEEAMTQRVIQQLLEEQRLEDAAVGYVPSSSSNAKTDDILADELPYCSICTEDATIRCHGCEGDLYCKRCFREGHENFDIGDHTYSPYKPLRPN